MAKGAGRPYKGNMTTAPLASGTPAFKSTAPVGPKRGDEALETVFSNSGYRPASPPGSAGAAGKPAGLKKNAGS